MARPLPDHALLDRARALLEQGLAAREVAAQIGVSRKTVEGWIAGGRGGHAGFGPLALAFDAAARARKARLESLRREANKTRAKAAPPPPPVVERPRPVDTRPIFTAEQMRLAVQAAAAAALESLNASRRGGRVPTLTPALYVPLRAAIHAPADAALRDGLALQLLHEVQERAKNEGAAELTHARIHFSQEGR